MKSLIKTTLICGLAAAFPAASVFAQQDDKRDRDRGDRETKRIPTRPQTDRQDRPQHRHPPRRDDEQSQRGRIKVDPQGWVTIYADYDNDGRIDGKETIFFIDLLRARGDSQMRQAAERSRQNRQWGRSPYPRQEQMAQVQGKIKDQAEFQLRGHDDHKFVMVKIDTEDNKTARVVLGMKEDLKGLNLSEGNVVTVKGERHQINNKPVLFARTVSAQGKTVKVSPAKSQNELRVRGTIESLVKREFRRRDDEFLVAQVDLVNGRTRTVILGPSDKLKPLNLEEGDEIRVMARNGRINDRPVLVASEVNAKNRTVSIPYAKPKSKDRSNETRREQTTLKPNAEEAIDRQKTNKREDVIER